MEAVMHASPTTTPAANDARLRYADESAMARTTTTTTTSFDADAAWAAVLARDAQRDGQFVYAVKTTGVYCRPSCPSRRPHRQNVEFFETCDAAEASGQFRACKRCDPRASAGPAAALVEAVRAYIDDHLDDRLTLSKLARHVGFSLFHLQRTFKRVTGLTPAQYASARRAERFRHELKQGANVTRATYDAGYGSSIRLYAVSNAHLGMTPGAYRRGGRGMHIQYATAASPFGRLLVAATERGICAVQLGDDDGRLEAALEVEYPLATRERAPDALMPLVSAVLAYLDGTTARPAVSLDVQATEFKWRVWRALQQIPYGETRTYGEVAAAVGAPRAVRAVANACATNQAAIVIPCHRVIGVNGRLAGYRWGLDRKRKLLDHERGAATAHADADAGADTGADAGAARIRTKRRR
jgi:AraC family transcriptional regulator, regulatory protein of adaptative response / methylated-DNA-[protein]-cysteine methyltransferase